MKKNVFTIGILMLIVLSAFYVKANFSSSSSNITFKKSTKTANFEELKDGDLIFQSSFSGQSLAIQLATKSIYSHCGIVFFRNGEPFVLEGVQPVSYAPLDEWIARGDKNQYAVKRLKNAEELVTKEVIENMKLEGEKLLGKNYDLTFEWSDDKIYCSELIWKIYKRALNIEIGKLQKLREFDLSSDVVKTKLKERYGTNIPLDEDVISPGAIFESEVLETVEIN